MRAHSERARQRRREPVLTRAPESVLSVMGVGRLDGLLLPFSTQSLARRSSVPASSACPSVTVSRSLGSREPCVDADAYMRRVRLLLRRARWFCPCGPSGLDRPIRPEHCAARPLRFRIWERSYRGFGGRGRSSERRRLLRPGPTYGRPTFFSFVAGRSGHSKRRTRHMVSASKTHGGYTDHA